jgi:hypothetical protein
MSTKMQIRKLQEEATKYKNMYLDLKDSSDTSIKLPPCTRDYDMFVFNEMNRPLHWDKELERSMRTYGFLPSCPISVIDTKDGKYKIKCGHNRFAMAKKLGLKIYYVVDETDISITYLEGEAGKNIRWRPSDWVAMWAQQGKHDYLLVREYATRNGVNESLMMFLYNGGAVSTRKIMQGNFKIVDAAFAYRVLDVADKMQTYGVTFAKSNYFIRAMSYVLRIEDFDESRLLAKVKSTPKYMQNRTDIKGFFEEIEGVYNFRSQDDFKLPIKLLAEKISKRIQKDAQEKIIRRTASI